MKTTRTGCTIAVVLALLSGAAAGNARAAAASGAKPGSHATAKFDRRDFNGLWLAPDVDYFVLGGVGAIPKQFPSKPELKGKYLADYEQREQTLARAGIASKMSCSPLGVPALMVAPYANEILQTSKQMNWFQEFPGETRRIYLDGRPHPDPEEYPASLTGHSTGRWDGDTLVAETVNIRTDTTLDEDERSERGLGHSEKMRIVERMRLIGVDRLQIDTTVEDPEALVRPWQYTLTFNRHPGQEVLEYHCEDSNHESLDPSGHERTELPVRTGRGITDIPSGNNQSKPAGR